MKRYRRTPSQEPAYKLLDAALERALVPPRLSHDFQDRLDARLTAARASAETNRSTRGPRLHVPGGVYYVVLRGKERKSSFIDATSYALFEGLLATVLARCRARVHAFCWEGDAIHFVLQVTDVPVGTFVRRLSSRYVRLVHRRHGESRHFFEGRYHSLLIDPDAYLLQLVRYLHLIPVRSGTVSDPSDYALSSHRAYLGLTQIPWLTSGVVLRMLAQRSEQARDAYRRLLCEALAPEEGKVFERGSVDDPRVLGDRQFIAGIFHFMRVYRSSYSLDQVIDTVSSTLGVERNEVLSRSRQRRLSLARALIAWYATERGVATLAEVARRLGRDPSVLFVAIERYRTLRPELFELTISANSSKLAQPQVVCFDPDSGESQWHSAQDPDCHNVSGKGGGILERITWIANRNS